jgi:N-methylhydantoinase A
MTERTRLAVDIGGTFTDLALEHPGGLATTKVLTTSAAPEAGVMSGVRIILAAAGLAPSDIQLIIHGTTLATNAIIERKGARTALVTTDGFRDVLALGNESRYDQYDLNIVLPEPLVPRRLRLTVPERLDRRGRMLLPLDEKAVRALAPFLNSEGVESIAVGFLHGFVNPIHERRTAEILAEELPGVPISMASEVSPEMREWERFSTTAANAYVQPLMARYLRGLERDLREIGIAAPIFMMLSGGNLATIDAACRFPIRLVESGPRRRRHLLGERGAPLRARTRAIVRYGRDHGQDLPDRRLCAAGLAQLRGGAGRPLQEGLRSASAHSCHRYGRNRRRRREPCSTRRAQPHRRRA